MPECRFYIRGLFWKFSTVPVNVIHANRPTRIRFKFHPGPNGIPPVNWEQIGMHQPFPKEKKEFEFYNTPSDPYGFQCDDKDAYALLYSKEC